MSFEEELIKNKKNLDSLKDNIKLNLLKSFIDELRMEWNPKTKEFNGTIGHGSKSGDEINFLLYFDEYKQEWTTKEMAFRGYVYRKINKII